jgi:hypothetical protein
MVLQNTPIIYMHPVLYGMNWNVDLKDSGTGAGNVETCNSEGFTFNHARYIVETLLSGLRLTVNSINCGILL